MSKLFMKTIEACVECPENIPVFGTMEWKCKKMDRATYPFSTTETVEPVPDWCPLPDADD